jgi:DNA-binding MarR family transcriptional regulator
MASIETKAAELMGHLGALARRYLFQDTPDREEEVPLARQELRVLLTVGEAGVQTMGRMAHELAVSLSALTAIVDRLVAKELVHRYRSNKDRRVVHVELTDQGRRIHERRRRARMRMATAMLEALTRRDQDGFLTFMRKIRAAAIDDAGAARVSKQQRPPARTGKARRP